MKWWLNKFYVQIKDIKASTSFDEWIDKTKPQGSTIDEDNTVSYSKWTNLEMGSYSSKHNTNQQYSRYNPIQCIDKSIPEHGLEPAIECDYETLDSKQNTLRPFKFKNWIETDTNDVKTDHISATLNNNTTSNSF